MSDQPPPDSPAPQDDSLPSTSASSAPSVPPTYSGRRYLAGLGLGFIPVLLISLSGVFFCAVTFGNPPCSSFSGPENPDLTNGLTNAALAIYFIEILVMLVCLFIKDVRYVGYGLLTMVLIGPIVAVVGLSTIQNATHTQLSLLQWQFPPGT